MKQGPSVDESPRLPFPDAVWDEEELGWPSDLIDLEALGLEAGRSGAATIDLTRLEADDDPDGDPDSEARRAILAAQSRLPFSAAFADVVDRPSADIDVEAVLRGTLEAQPKLKRRAAPVDDERLSEVDQSRSDRDDAHARAKAVFLHERSRHVTSVREWVGLGTLAALAAVLAVSAGASPTGTTILDALYSLGLVALLVVAGSHARRWALVVGAAGVAMGGSGLSGLFGALALLAVGFLVVRGVRSRVLGGAVGALVGVGALHYPAGGSTAWGFVLPVAACVVILGSGYANAPEVWQRRARRGAVVAAGLVGVLSFLAVVVVLAARASIERGIRETEAAVGQVESGDREQAALDLAEAQEAFESAHARLGFIGWAPIQAVPVVSQNFRAIREASAVGEEMTSTLQAEVLEVDYDELNRPGGGVDVQTLRGFRGPVHRADQQLQDSIATIDDLESTWLLGPIDGRLDDLRGRLASYQDESGLAALAVDRGPAMLGAGGSRRYLILLGNPAEARDLGGHLGSWAEMTFTDGKMDLVEVGGPNDLSLPATEATEGTLADYPPSLVDMDPRRYPQNWGTDTDLPTVARLSAQLFEERTGRTLDGVAYADPDAFAAIVALTGPQTVAGTTPPYEVTAQNASRFLTVDQFELFDTEQQANEATQQLVRDVFDELTTTRLPDPRSLGERFSPLVDEGRFAFTSLHDEDRALLERMQVERRMPDVDGANLLGVVERNANPSKIDAYLHRTTDARYRWNPESGSVTGVVTVRLRNDAPTTGLDPVVIGNQLGLPSGTNVTDVALLTGFEVQDVTVDGEPVGVQPTAVDGYWRHTVRATLPAGGRATVRYRIRGTVTPGSHQRLEVIGQPLVNDETTVITVTPVGGGSVTVDGQAERRTTGGGARITVRPSAHRTIELTHE